MKTGFLLFACFSAAADRADPQAKFTRTENSRTIANLTFQKDMKLSDAASRKSRAHFAEKNLWIRK